MPTSRPNHLSWLCQKILDSQPKSILDIGVGFGSKGMLFREYTDIWNGQLTNWETRIDGIEIFESYITDLQRKIYSNIYIGNALTVLDSLGQYDLIYLGDVLEHFSKEDGFKLIEKMKNHAKEVIIVTPIVVSKQGAVYGNENERHISEWADQDFVDSTILKMGNVKIIMTLS